MRKTILLFVAALFSAALCAQSVSFEGANVDQFQATMANNGTKIFNVPLVGSYELVAKGSRSFTMTDVIHSSDMFLPAKRKGESKDVYAERLALAVKESLNSLLTELKAKALYLFAEQENADLIASPTFAITTKKSDEDKIEVEIRIKGFPARYTSIRPLQASDSSLVKTSRLIENDIKTIDLEVTRNENREVTKSVSQEY